MQYCFWILLAIIDHIIIIFLYIINFNYFNINIYYVNARGRFSDHKLLLAEIIQFFSYFTFRYLYIIIFICQGDSRMSRYLSENVTILLIISQVIDIIYDQNYR